MKNRILKVKCITNMHMGSGDVNFNIVDCEVERDPVTNFPTMYASGVKGAIRDYYKDNRKDDSKYISKEVIFGKASSNDDGNAGSVKFLNGQLLFQAVRASSGNEIYYLVTCKTALMEYAKLIYQISGEDILKYIDKIESNSVYGAKEFGIEGKKYNNVLKIDDNDSIMKIIKLFVEECDISKVVIVPDEDFKNIPLPVIARNQLNENGISKFLWYEEYVPHESIFYIPLLSNNDDELNALVNYISDNSLIQFGGNASIGCGLCEVKVIGGQNNNE